VPADRLAAAADAYVRFAAVDQALFEALFAAGLDKGGHRELPEAGRPIGPRLAVRAGGDQVADRVICPGRVPR
jgi:hypothetical protein